MKNNNTVSVSFMLLGILFCVCLVAANLLETKVVQIWKITATAGLVVFPISYIINDCIAEVWGFRKARLIIWMGFAMNFMVVALAQLAILMPAAPFWEGEEGFNFVFGMAPRIAVASLTAFLVGSFLNAYVMSKMKLASGGKNFSLRAITSTLVGESADSMIFFPVSFVGSVHGTLGVGSYGVGGGLGGRKAMRIELSAFRHNRFNRYRRCFVVVS